MPGNVKPDTRNTEQAVLNRTVDDLFDVLAVEPVEYDGSALQRAQSKIRATKITTSGNNTYIGFSPVGTPQSEAKWQCKKITVIGNDTTITWADGNALFDNTATDLTSLTYS